jgi:hypothetical protein
MMKFLTLPPSRQRLFSSAKSRDDDLDKGVHPIKPSSASRHPLLRRHRSRWQRHVPYFLTSRKWTSSSSSSHAPDPVTSSSASSSSAAEYSYHDSSSISNTSVALGCNPSIIHEVRSVPSMGESVLGVYLETSPSGDDTPVPSANRDAAQNPEGEGIKPFNRFTSCLRLPDWVRKWTTTPVPSFSHRRSQRQRRRLGRPDRFRQWRYGGGIPRQPLASSSDGSSMDDDNDVDSLQASAHFSISCVSNSRSTNAMERLAWDSHDDDDDEEDEDEFYEARHEEASPILTDTMRSSSSSTASSSYGSPPGRRPFMTLDSYLSRHNPQIMKSKASKVTKTTAASTSAATPSTGGNGGAAKVVDIAHVDTSDNQSVHSEMCMAVSFDHDYAQLVLTATAQDDDDDEDDDDELSTFAGDDLLGIAHSHPAAASGNRCPSPPPSFVRGESQAPPPRYSMRQNPPHAHTGANPRPLSVRPRNPWRDMVVEEDEDGDAGSFRGVEEWSVAAASVLIETTFTDWGASHDDDDADEDEDDDASNSKHGGGAVLAASSSVKVRHTKLGAGSLPPRPPGAAQRPLARMPLDSAPGSPSDRGEDNEEDGESFRSDESECPFDERAFKAPHLRSAQPGRRSQFASAPRSGSKRAVPLVEV